MTLVVLSSLYFTITGLLIAVQ